jgi:hemerythrin superfamily protein
MLLPGPDRAPITRRCIMDVFKLLKADHEKVAGILEKLDQSTERAVKLREELFEKLNAELSAHAYAEEKILYPAVKEVDDTRDIGFEAIEEHKIVKTLLSELASLSKDSEEWSAKLSVLKENVEHHVEEEENEMFPKFRKALDKDEIEAMGDEIQMAKEEYLLSVHA